MSFTEGAPIPIRELLIEATFAPNRAIRPDVRQIDLGILGQEAEGIYDRSAEEREWREYQMHALVTSDRRLLLNKEPIVGGLLHARTSITFAIKPNSTHLPKDQRQNRHLGAIIHNHPIEYPPSYEDIRPIFLHDNETFAMTALLISSPECKTVVFRGQNTPQWGESTSRENIEKWNTIYRDGVDKFENLDITDVEKYLMDQILQTAIFAELAKVYDLQIFRCPLRENVASLQTYSALSQ